MTVGLPPDKAQLDAWSGALARDVVTWMNRVDKLQALLAGLTNPVLQAAPYGYTQPEIDLLKSGVLYMKQQADAYRAGANHVFTDQLAGLGTF
jgi:hypothetical protein